MPIDLIGAVVAWLVAASGDAGIRLIRGSGDERMLRKAVRVAVDAVVREADPALQKPLRAGLTLCFSSPPAMKLDAATRAGDWLPAAIAAQVSQLEGWVNNETGRPFYQDVPVDPIWLSGRVTDAIITALRQVIVSGNLPEVVRDIDTIGMLARLDDLGLLGQQTAARLKAIEQSVGLRNQAVASAALAPEEYQEAFLKLCKVPHRDLAGILPYLAGHVSSALVMVPGTYEGRRLKDAELQFIRQDLQVSVVALRHEGDAEWLAGGAVSETPLTAGAELLVCGPKLAIAKLQARLGAPEAEAGLARPRSSPA